MKKNTANILTFVIATAISFALTACATSPEGRKQLTLLPDEQLNAMGVQSFEQIKQETPITENKNVENYVRCIANRIIPHVAENPNPAGWEVQVFESDQANAFALPGY